MPPRLSVPLALLPWLVTLAACGDGAEIVVYLEKGNPDPFQGVSTVRLEAAGPDMQTLRAEASLSSGEVRLPPIPFGTGRHILVEGLDAERFVISRGESALFDVSASGPDRVTVRFAGCGQDLFRDDDGDSYGAAGPARVGCAQPGWAPRGDDCDDTEADAHPGQSEYFTRPGKGSGRFDFNCDGREEQQSTSALPDCAAAGASCKAEQGWAGAVPGCGEQGQLGSCAKQGGTCAPTTEPQVQACR